MAAANRVSFLPSRPVFRSSSSLPSFLTSTSSLYFPHSSCFLASPLSLSPALDCTPSLLLPVTHKGASRILYAVEEKPTTAAETTEELAEGDSTSGPSEEQTVQGGPCELYVCNLPRSCDTAELFELFKPYGMVQSAEVSRNPETGLSRGSAFVTMSSTSEAKAAIAGLDGSDLCGREMRVRFSYDLFSEGKGTDVRPTSYRSSLVETPYKAYVGNLAWSVRPQHLKEHFSQFGEVVTARVVFDRKTGRTRTFGFVSFSSPEELQAALSSSGQELRGRTMLVREVFKK